LAWGHCREAPELSVGCKKTKLVCLYCAKVFAGGGINRFKQHLTGAKGEVDFLVYCPKGTVFLKTVDVSDVSKTARLLYQLFREVVLYVGVENIVHMVTDNAANYVAAGRLLMEEFPSILWSPCDAHCINLIL